MNSATSLPQPRIIPPLSGRFESILFVLAALMLVASTAGYVLLKPKNEGPPELLSWQVSSFDGLSTVDQAIHSALLPAAEEIIWANNDTGTWLTIPELEGTLLPPFYRDNFWKTNGEVKWQVIMPGATSTAVTEAPPVDTKSGLDPFKAPNKVYQGTLGQGAASYYGSGGTAPGQSTYLVVIGHAHSGVYFINQATLWIHKNPNEPLPDVLKAESLVSHGWRQIIPYNGASEVERVKGKDNG
ncbi:MAG: hypothetical protein AB7F79_10290 [Steroidobacteraceae bacterium]